MIAVEEKYYKVDEVAKRFKVSRQAVYQWIAHGKLRAVKLGSHTRIPESALKDFIKPVGEDADAGDL